MSRTGDSGTSSPTPSTQNLSDNPLGEAQRELQKLQERGEVQGNAVVDELNGKIYAAIVEPDYSEREFNDEDVPYNQFGEILVYDRFDDEFRPAKELEESHIRRYFGKNNR